MSAPYFTPDQDWLSECCGVPPLGPVFEWTEMGKGGLAVHMASGTCRRCRQLTNFTKDETKTTTKGK